MVIELWKDRDFLYPDKDGPHISPISFEENLMAQIVKKAKATAKPRKTTAKKSIVVAISKGTTVPHHEVALLAHRFWAERGHQHGHPEADWFRAEQELRGKAS